MDYCTVATEAAFLAGFMAGLPVIYLVWDAKATLKPPTTIIDGTCEVIE